MDLNTGIDIYGIASSNPDLAPKGEEKGDIRLIVNPTFSVTGTVGERMKISGAGSLGASASVSLREGASFSTYLRPSGTLNGTLEVVDNWFFIDMRAGLQSALNDPFLATTWEWLRWILILDLGTLLWLGARRKLDSEVTSSDSFQQTTRMNWTVEFKRRRGT